jgi:hypothetical protein
VNDVGRYAGRQAGRTRIIAQPLGIRERIRQRNIAVRPDETEWCTRRVTSDRSPTQDIV